jgi:phage-related protein
VPDGTLIWLGSSRADLRAFPEDARRLAGFQLHRLQQGLLPNDWKRMPSVARGVCEIRVQTSREHRVLYVAPFAEGVYVLHAFEKRTRKTARRDLQLARNRFRSLLERKRKPK